MLKNNCMVIPMRVNGIYVKENNKFQIIDCIDHFDKTEVELLGIDLESKNDTYSSLQKGIYLHWVLPKAMREGIHEDGKTLFPNICNRYHVIRIMKKELHYDIKTIVIESDVIESEGKVSILTMNEEGLAHNYLGKKYEYGMESNNLNKGIFNLTSLGYGDPSFSGFFFKTENILSFYDDLKDIDCFEEICYLVIGYYHKTDFSPFSTIKNFEELNDILSQLKWKLEEKIDIPFDYITEGIIFLKSENNSIENEKEAFNLSIGHNIIEALSAQSKYSRDVQRLCRNHLNECLFEDTIIKEESDNHQDQFFSEESGIIYTIEKAELISTTEALELDKINFLQRKINKKNNQIISLQQDGYTLWYKYHYIMKDFSLDNDDKQEYYNKYYNLLKKIDIEINQYKSEIDEIQKNIGNKIDNFKKIKDEVYWSPKNPTFLIQSDNYLRNYKYGFDQRDEKILTCRIRENLLKTDIPLNIQGNYNENFLDFITEACIIFSSKKIISGSPPDAIAINYNERDWQYVSLLWGIEYEGDINLEHWSLENDDYFPKNLEFNQKYYITDRCIVTPQAESIIKSSLKKYCEIHNSEKIYQYLNNIGNIDTLSQTLGTFHEQLRGQKSTFQLPLIEVKKYYYTGENYHEFFKLSKEVIKNQTSTSIINNNDFHFIRAGKIKVKKAQLIDTFSRVKDISIDNIQVAESMLEKQEIILPPRLLQPARIIFEFGDRIHYSSCYPIIGWIRYNSLNNSLILYCSDGEYYGELKLIEEKLKILNKNYREISEEFKNIIYLLQSYPQYFYNLLNIIEKRQQTMKSKFITEEDTSMYINHPLALMKGTFTLEVKGEMIHNNYYDDEKNLSPLINYEFPITIGDERYHNDGMVGFFMNSHFYQYYDENAFFKKNKINTKIDVINEIILLMDPHLETTITTGILPKKRIQLTSDKYKNILQTMTCSFFLGPTLQPKDNFVLPLDELSGKIWLLDEKNINYEYSENLSPYIMYEGKLKMKIK